MTHQEIFNTVWQHFVVERNPASVSKMGGCTYRGLNGAKCAAGLFIRDEDYSRDFEYHSPNFLAEKCQFTCGNENVTFLIGLQICHDRSARLNRLTFTESMEERLRKFATKHSLTIPTTEAN